MNSRFLLLLDYFVPESLRAADAMRREQARLAVGIALALSIWGPFFAVTLWLMGSYTMAVASVAGSSLWLAILYTFQRTGSYTVFGNVVAATLYLELMLIASISRGFDANAMLWCLLIPMVATSIAGVRSGVFWGSLVLAGMLVYFCLHLAGIELPQWEVQDNLPWVRFFSLTALAILVTAMVALTEIFKNRAVEITRRTHEQMNEASASLASVLDHATDGIMTVNEEGTILTVNPAVESMFGYAAADLIGKNAAVLMSEQQQETEWLAGVRREMVGRHKDGTQLQMEISLSDVPTRGTRRYVGIIHDITDRCRVQDELQQEQHLLKRLLNAHEMERQLLAYEIHDGLVQHMTGALMHLESRDDDCEQDQRFQRGVSLVREGIREGRRLISGLRPPILDELGLVPAIEYLIREVEELSCPPIEFEPKVEFDRLQPLLESSLFRICQEGLTNARRYSQAQFIRIRLEQCGDLIRLRVSDDGIGFDTATVTEQSFGLAGIRERAKLLGGMANINSKPGAGTQIEVDVPLRLADEPDSIRTQAAGGKT